MVSLRLMPMLLLTVWYAKGCKAMLNAGGVVRRLWCWCVAVVVGCVGVIVGSGVASAQSVQVVRCDWSLPQVQFDTTRGPVCVTVDAGGELRVGVEDVYGVMNRSQVGVKVAFRLDAGEVFWQVAVPAGGVEVLDVQRGRTRVVEVQSEQVGDRSVGVGQGVLVDGGLVSFSALRGSNRVALGVVAGEDVLRGVGVDRWSGFEDRLDASFVLRSAPGGCFRLEAVNYPGVFVSAESVFAAPTRRDGVSQASVWCVDRVGDGVRLKTNIRGRDYFLQFAVLGGVGLTSQASRAAVWSVDEVLADPVGVPVEALR